MRYFFLAFVLPLAAGCSEDAGITGVWTGTSTSVTFQLTLVETPQGAVSGVGVLANGVTNTPANATGAHAHPALALTITFPQTNISPINYQGYFSRDLMTIRGVLNGSGFIRDSLTFSRMAPAARITGP